MQPLTLDIVDLELDVWWYKGGHICAKVVGLYLNEGMKQCQYEVRNSSGRARILTVAFGSSSPIDTAPIDGTSTQLQYVA